MTLTVSTYDDFKAAAAALTKPSAVYFLETVPSGEVFFTIVALAPEGAVYLNTNSSATAVPTAATVLADFPKAAANQTGFGVSG